MSNKFTKPILDMAGVARKIESGRRGIRNTYQANDELGYLANAFNEMAEALEKEQVHLRSYLQSMMDSMPSILIAVNKDREIIFWNRKAEQVTGISADKAVGRELGHCLPLLRDEHENINKALKSGEPFSLTSTFGKAGNLLHYQIMIYPLLIGELEGAVIRCDDVTEEREKDELLRRSQKMDALGKLTGGIAHDFNNILGIILGFCEILKVKLPADPDLNRYVDEIYNSGTRAQNLTSRLLSFARKGTISSGPVNVNELLLDEREMLQKAMTADIELIFILEEEPWQLFLDKSALQDAILNLCINSMHAMDGVGTVMVGTQNVTVGEEDRGHLDVRPGDYVLLTVSDTGVGMDEETQRKIFDPFFTTKGEGGQA